MRVLGLFSTSMILFSGSAMGAGFALQEHSISGLGVGFASGASGGPDNSAMYFNPASLIMIDEQQVTAGFHLITPVAKFKNTGTTSGYIPGVSPGVPTQGGNSTSDDPALVPNVYYSRPLSENAVIGVGLSAPWGLATSYTKGWVGRYVALETDLQTVNLNLAMAWKASDMVTVGFGVSGMHGDATLSNAINFGLGFLSGIQSGDIPLTPETAAIAQDAQNNLGGDKYDGYTKLTGDDIGYGWNVGVLFTPNENTRIGVHYRSKVTLDLEGKAKFDVGLLDPFFGPIYKDQGGAVSIDLPDTFQVSIHHQVTPRMAVMADVYHTWWSKFKELDISFDGGLPNSVVPENWKDVFRYSVGATYLLNEEVELRGGLVFDESPVPSNKYRSPRIPDEDRIWLSAGVGWKVSDRLTVDAAFVYIMVDDPVIDNPTHTRGESLKGKIDAMTTILSVACSYTF